MEERRMETHKESKGINTFSHRSNLLNTLCVGVSKTSNSFCPPEACSLVRETDTRK